LENNYARIIRDNLTRLYDYPPDSLEKRLPATKETDRFILRAFGQACVISPAGILLEDKEVTDPRGIIISLYALHAPAEPCLLNPFRAYKEFPNTMPYAAAFHARTEQTLVPYAERISKNVDMIRKQLDGGDAPAEVGGDLAFTVNPLPKIHLCYIFYAADEDFPASVTCLYSSNAANFLPPDALADTGEYTSKKIIEIITG
jgi:hypothetical protein